MADLKTGTLCIIVAGCPENIGMIVKVVSRFGRIEEYEDCYKIKTVTGRNFRQLWVDKNLKIGTSTIAYTERHKLRPLVEDGAPDIIETEALDQPNNLSVSA